MKFLQRDADHADAGRLLDAYLQEIADRLRGFDPQQSVSAEPEEMSPPRGFFLVGYQGATPIACGGGKRLDDETVELKRMFVVPAARGHGAGRALLAALEQAVAATGARRIVLDTAAVLDEAKALYDSSGYRRIAPYNNNPYAALWFEKIL